MNSRSNGAKPLAGYRALINVLKFDERGLIPAVIQDLSTKQVLTLCYFNAQALEKSLETGTVYVFRRSQNRLMQKGETSGHLQMIRQLLVDCEGKSLLVLVRQHVAACHAGYFSCYYRQRRPAGPLKIIAKKVFDPRHVYRAGGKAAA